MTYTLLLRLAGPMQAWGLQSRFSIRDTAREPTKSGVIGLVCAALGRPRDAPLDDLAALRMGVRVDQEGQLRRDFQTAQDIVKASAKLRPGKPVAPSERKDTEPSERYFLADAWFTVALESEDRALLERIDAALAAPVWTLCLGRKSCPPGVPVHIGDSGAPAGLHEGSLLDVLPGFRDPFPKAPSLNGRSRLVLDASLVKPGMDVVMTRMQPDEPVSFSSRRFLPRKVAVCYTSTENGHVSEQTRPQPE